MDNNNNDFVRMTPAPDRRLVALHKCNEKGEYNWVEIHKGETVLVAKCYVPLLRNKGLVVGKSQKVYKTREEAENEN